MRRPAAVLLCAMATTGVATSVVSGRVAASAQDLQVAEDRIQSLQDALFEAANDLARLRTGDATLRVELTRQLDALRDDVRVLRSRLRGVPPVTASEVLGVRDRLDLLRRRARGPETATAADAPPGGSAPTPETRTLAIAEGTDVVVRLLTYLDVREAMSGDRVEAATVSPVIVGDNVRVPTGALLTGAVSHAEAKSGTLSVHFDRLTFDYDAYVVDAEATWAGTDTELRATFARRPPAR